MTQEAQLTATRDSWKALPCPEKRKALEFNENYSLAEFDRIRQGLIPIEMEDKWFIFYEAPWLYAHRSWSGICIYAVRFDDASGGASVAESWVNRSQYSETRPDYDRALLKFLIDALLLGRRCEFPLPSDVPKDAPDGLFQHVMVGRGYPEATFQVAEQARPSLWDRLRQRFKR
jgi:hypothetical protein